jgi:nucleoside-triphosphatase THEP1
MKNLLITGSAGAGKTTLIKKLSEIFKEFNPAGFYSSEITEEGAVTGFSVTQLFGDSIILSHLDLKSKYSVGKYHVDIKGFETMLENIFSRDKKTGLYFIDEIGKMECQSNKFGKLISDLLNGDKLVIATISEKGTGIIQDIKKRDDIRLYEITHDNRDQKLKELTMEIRDLLLE